MTRCVSGCRRGRARRASSDPTLPVEFGGLGLGHGRPGAGVRGGRLLAVRPAGAATQPRPTRATASPGLVADTAQRDHFLAPLAGGEVRSAFAMTEPAPGAGSDPSPADDPAEPVSGGWRDQRREDVHHRRRRRGLHRSSWPARRACPGDAGGATMFLAPADTPGIRRRAARAHDGPVDARAATATSCFEGCRGPRRRRAGRGGRGFPLRAGAPRPGPDDPRHAVARRRPPGPRRGPRLRVASGWPSASRLGDLGMVQQHDRRQRDRPRRRPGRCCWRPAAELGRGRSRLEATSIAKAFAGEALYRVADRATQICGGLGVSARPAGRARSLSELRPFRIYDGPSEVHRWSIARRALRQAARDRA